MPTDTPQDRAREALGDHDTIADCICGDAECRLWIEHALAPPPSSDRLRDETGWLIEHGSHKIPTYWSKDGWGRWSSDHRKAIRFSRRQDAFAVSLMLGDKPNDAPHRIVEHAWSDKGSPALAERDKNIRVMGFCEKCNRYLPLIGKLCQKCTDSALAPPSTDAVALREALEPFVSGADHARVFLTSRQKMHPAGVALYDEDVERARQALSQPPTIAGTRARKEGRRGG